MNSFVTFIWNFDSWKFVSIIVYWVSLSNLNRKYSDFERIEIGFDKLNRFCRKSEKKKSKMGGYKRFEDIGGKVKMNKEMDAMKKVCQLQESL